MGQFDFGNKDPAATSGTQLMDSILEPWRDALHSNHKGPARPGYVTAGMHWILDVANPWILYYFDGSEDLPIAAMNNTTHVLSLYHNGSLLGTAATKDTGTGSGNVPTNADLGDLAILDVGHGLEINSGTLRIKLDGASIARSSSGLKVADNAIDLDQLAHKTANTLLGMNASGVPSVIAAGTNITIDNGVINGAGHVVVDRAYTSNSAATRINALVPFDDTVPQVGEGTEVLSASITPKSITNRIRIRCSGFMGSEASGIIGVVSFFVNGGANAVQSVIVPFDSTTHAFCLEYEYVPGALTSQTISVRVGTSNVTYGIRLNSFFNARILGGAAKTTLVLEEVFSS